MNAPVPPASRLLPASRLAWPTWALTDPHRPALIAPAADGQLQSLSWQQLTVATERLATRLQQAGWQAGDRLLHTAGNSAAGVIAALASAAIGTVEVPLANDCPPQELAAIATQLSGRIQADLAQLADATDLAGLTDRQELRQPPSLPPPNGGGTTGPNGTAPADAADAAQQLLERLQQHDDGAASLILLTSGSRGRPQAVVLSRRSLQINAAAKLAAVPQRRDDLRLTLLPIYHAYARTSDLGTWLGSGCTLAIGLGWDGWTRLADRLRPSLLNSVPSLAMRLAQLPANTPGLSRLRLLGCGGAALPSHWFDRFRQRGITVIQGYGLTEAGPVICSATPENARPGAVGGPVPGWQTRLDADGRLWVKGEAVMLGYWQDPAATRQRLVDGWLDTGDIVQVDPDDGQYRILGRADDRLTLDNGRKLYPAAIEQRAAGLPGVRHAVLLAAGRHCELWLDVDPETEPAGGWHQAASARLADLPSWQRPVRTRVMPPLADQPGLLTAKGTPVRPRVIERIESQWR